ncbi:PACE efflux transporter [Parendozoicomonas haliclonae]|uniref:Bacterial Transmembrane Pair family protein n=1 Tax=Parendozoicomonas haliclonae TaxID=1960125 RepID=A0A1X7APJ5_9GAMM|nr:PACE efflux transporter [Parendozoicomonas haliclonae]SMA50175.1 Bacterial Transmembrane Pair family protein [Parendozoicomonas haliclonae]
MSIKERIVHMFLFEIIALAMFVPLAMLASGQSAGAMAGLSIALSVIAMLWNFVFNWVYDSIRGDDRASRKFSERLLHGAGFELGMIATSFPAIMYVTQESFLNVLIMDIGAVTFFFIYAIIFNWVYDVIRSRYVKQPATITNE